MGNMTHCARIMVYMREHGGITSQEAFAQLGVSRLAARIRDLRDDGHHIDGKMITVLNRYGERCRVKQYTLREGES